MRKFWFIYLAKAIIVFPGGFGTMDELFEVLTLDQTGKLTKPIKIILFGEHYWRDVINFEAFADYGTISPQDIGLMQVTDSADEAIDLGTEDLLTNASCGPGGGIELA